MAYEATRDANTMTISGQDIQDWKGKLGDWLAARWRGLIVAVLLLFVLNNLAGLLAGFSGIDCFRQSHRGSCPECSERGAAGQADRKRS